MIETKILTRFADDMAAAYIRLAEGLRERGEPQQKFIRGPELVEMLPGHRQRAVYDYLKKQADDSGKSTREINDGIGYDFSNTYTTLQRLRDLGIVEMIPGVRPQRWRLSQKFRGDTAN